MKDKKLAYILILLVLFAFSLSSSSALASNIIYISVTGSDTTGDGSAANPFRTVQKGIDVASSGDTVFVQPGVYQERINLKSGVTVQGTSADNTIIDGQQGGVVVKAVNVNGSTLNGFTIQGGRSGNEGGGIYVANSTNVQILNNHITGNVTDGVWEQSNGGGVRIVNSSLLVARNKINNNFARFWGGGLYIVVSEQKVVVEDNVIASNVANLANGGGGLSVWLGEQARVEIKNNQIKQNAAGNAGGGIEFAGLGSGQITGNLISDNYTYTSDNGGGGIALESYMYNKLRVLVANNIIKNNYTAGHTLSGGGILVLYALGPETKIINNTIVNNAARQAGGIGVYYSSRWGLPGSNPTIANNIIWGNKTWAGEPSDLSGVGQWGWPPPAAVAASYNLIGSGLYYGTGNISGDPQFVDAVNQDFRLKLTSPAIDAGNRDYVPAWLTEDFANSPRIINGQVDIGAYEFGFLYAAISGRVEAEISTDTTGNELGAKGYFVLNGQSNGINPQAEVVNVKIGDFTVDIPASSFRWWEHPKKPAKDEYKFEGTINSLPVEMKIKPLGNGNYEFKFEVQGLYLSWFKLPVKATLIIGDDYGSFIYSP